MRIAVVPRTPRYRPRPRRISRTDADVSQRFTDSCVIMHASFDGISVIWTGDDMKTLFAASLTGLALLTGSALAADLPPAPQVYKAPPVMAPAYSWTGCYVNGGFGYGVSNTDHNAETLPGLVPIDGRNTSGARGWLGVARAGCDYEGCFGGVGNLVVR